MINEEILKEDANPVISGEQIADMMGMGDTYRQGKQAEMQDNEMRESVKGKFASLIERMQKTQHINNEIID